MITEAVLALWAKIIPLPTKKENQEDYSKSELESI